MYIAKHVLGTNPPKFLTIWYVVTYLNTMWNLQLIILDIDVLILQYVLSRRSKLMGAISEKLRVIYFYENKI